MKHLGCHGKWWSTIHVEEHSDETSGCQLFFQGDPVPYETIQAHNPWGHHCLLKRVHLIGHETYRWKQLCFSSPWHQKLILVLFPSSYRNMINQSAYFRRTYFFFFFKNLNKVHSGKIKWLYNGGITLQFNRSVKNRLENFILFFKCIYAFLSPCWTHPSPRGNQGSRKRIGFRILLLCYPK